MKIALVLVLVVVVACLSGGFSKILVDPISHRFVDEFGRTRIFHGVNSVYKVFPWYPQTTGFDAKSSLSDIDAKNLKGWGFNVVRLGVMWPGVEPGERGVYNTTYLDQIETIVNNLKANDIYVVLDLHQDLFHRKFCGEGVPDYVYDLCHRVEPPSTKPFPLPAVNQSYPSDANGDPTIESCLSKMFATYYMSAEVGAGFQCLYSNRLNLWDAMAGFWRTVAQRFSSSQNVLGYELLNEPWAGDIYEDPRRLLPGHTESKYLQPLYQHLHKAIREVDDEKIIFFEGLTIDYFPNGFTEGPGGADYNDRQALAYHIYCPLQSPTAKGEVACDAINDEFFFMRQKDVDRIGGGMIMTEFGASEDIKGDLYALEKNCAQADKHMQSWMYWQFKYYEDLTTCTPVGESLYNEDGSVCIDKVKVLSRTYPTAIAGSPISYHFNPVTSKFTLELIPLSEVSKNPRNKGDAATTSLYYNKELYYSHGVNVNINGVTGAGDAVVDVSSSFTTSCSRLSSGFIDIQQTEGLIGDVKVTIALDACRVNDLKTCQCK